MGLCGLLILLLSLEELGAREGLGCPLSFRPGGSWSAGQPLTQVASWVGKGDWVEGP